VFFGKTVNEVTFRLLTNPEGRCLCYFFHLSDQVKLALSKRILELCVKYKGLFHLKLCDLEKNL